MVYADFDGRDIVKVLRKMKYRPVSRHGSHVRLRYDENGVVRNVDVPITKSDNISQDTYRSIAKQCGAHEFEEWVAWIEFHL